MPGPHRPPEGPAAAQGAHVSCGREPPCASEVPAPAPPRLPRPCLLRPGVLSGVSARGRPTVFVAQTRLLAAAGPAGPPVPQLMTRAPAGRRPQRGHLRVAKSPRLVEARQRVPARGAPPSAGLGHQAGRSLLAGGSILGTRCSETHETKTALISLFGIPLWYFSQSPRVVIQVSGPCGWRDRLPARLRGSRPSPVTGEGLTRTAACFPVTSLGLAGTWGWAWDWPAWLAGPSWVRPRP